MASYPPPPPGPQGAPFRFDAKEQARFYRQQAKAREQAQKAAYRAQRNLLRQQAQNLRRGSILGPVLLVTIGVVALLISMGRVSLPLFAVWYARWWPVVIVGAGLVMAAEWAFDQWATRKGQPVVRRGMGAGAVLLILLLIFTGFTARSVHDNKDLLNSLSINSENVQEIFGQKYEREQQIDQPFVAGSSLLVENPHGDVTLIGKSDDGQIHITVNKQVYSWSEADADAKAEQMQPQLDFSSGTLHVVLPGNDGLVSDLTITLPEGTQTTLNTGHGDIRVSGMHAPVNLTASRGDAELSNINGSVTARMDNSHATFTAHDITGGVTMKGRADDVNLSNVSGGVSLEGEFYGDTHLERLLGPVSFHTSRTQFSLARLPGQVDISPDSELSGEDLAGPTELHTRSRNISLQRVSGSIDVSNSNGTVDLSNTLPIGAVTIENKNGAVNITVPERSGLSIAAEATDGEVENDFALQPVSSKTRSELHGVVGDGATRISIHTSHDNIALHKQEVSAPPPPQAPTPPAKPAKPLKASKSTESIRPSTPVPSRQDF